MSDLTINTTSNTNIELSEKESLKALRKMLKEHKNVNKDTDYESLFKEYLQQETNLSSEEIALQVENLDSLEIFDELKNQQENQENDSSTSTDEGINQLEIFNDVLNVLFEEEEILKNLDTNQDNIFDEEEKIAYLNAIAQLDGDGENASLEDILTSAKGMMEGKTLEEVTMLAEASSVIDEPEKATPQDVQQAGGGTKLTKQNTHSSNYTEPDGTIKSTTTQVTTQDEIQKIEQQIQAKNDEKIQLKAGEAEYTQMVTDLKTINTNLATQEADVEKTNSQLHETNFQLEAVKAQLSNMSEPVIFDEYKADYEKQKSALEAQQKELETKQNDLNKELEEKQAKLKEIQEQKEAKEQEIEAYEQAHPSDEIDKINEEIKNLENQKQQLQEELKKQREQELQDAQVYGKAQAHRESELVKFMMDYATNPQTKEKYDKWYYEQFNGKAYCAIFTSDVVGIMYAKAAEKMGIDSAKLEEFYKNEDKTCPKGRGVGSLNFASSVAGTAAWGEEMQTALNNEGINVDATVDLRTMSEEERKNAVREGKVYPGMAFTYMENGRLHIGFVESINADLSWNTIEGNTSVKYADGSSENHTVGSHKRDATFEDLSTVTDATVKVLYWMKKMGYSEKEINDLIY